jgi:chromate transporter
MKLGWLLFPSLFVIFWIFFKIGLVFFGGGYVVLPVIHRELVTNLHLLTEQEFIDGTAISQLTPGPVAIIATFAGFIIANVWGALVGTFAMFFTRKCIDVFNFKKL